MDTAGIEKQLSELTAEVKYMRKDLDKIVDGKDVTNMLQDQKIKHLEDWKTESEKTFKKIVFGVFGTIIGLIGIIAKMAWETI